MKTRDSHGKGEVRDSSMEEARSERPMVLRQSVRVLQVTGCFPFPLTHLLRMSPTISAGTWWQLILIWSTRLPSSSPSSTIPRSSNFDPTFSLMLMVSPETVGKEMNSPSFGLSSVRSEVRGQSAMAMGSHRHGCLVYDNYNSISPK